MDIIIGASISCFLSKLYCKYKKIDTDIIFLRKTLKSENKYLIGKGIYYMIGSMITGGVLTYSARFAKTTINY
jgi:hypothetical protein